MDSITPAQLSLELQVTSKRVRDVLRDEFGLLPPGKGRWLLSPAEADSVRARVGLDASSQVWSLRPGDEVRRRAVHRVYGGQQQGGISTPKSIDDVLIFTDPDSGKEFGYDRHEGLREDGNYSYTGEGQVGDQSIDKRGNAALIRAAASGNVIRLFRTQEVYATYVGAFTLGNPAYWEKEIPDRNGAMRSGFVFNLEPIDADTEFLPPYGGKGLAEPVVKDWTAPDFDDVLVEPGPSSSDLEARTVSRLEFELQNDFGKWLAANGDEPKSLTLPVDGSNIMPDLYVPSRGWIVEAKRSVARDHVRTAIGQVLDYAHAARELGVSAAPLILIPGAPSDSLGSLLRALGISLAHRSDDGEGFTIVSSD